MTEIGVHPEFMQTDEYREISAKAARDAAVMYEKIRAGVRERKPPHDLNFATEWLIAEMSARAVSEAVNRKALEDRIRDLEARVSVLNRLARSLNNMAADGVKPRFRAGHPKASK